MKRLSYQTILLQCISHWCFFLHRNQVQHTGKMQRSTSCWGVLFPTPCCCVPLLCIRRGIQKAVPNLPRSQILGAERNCFLGHGQRCKESRLTSGRAGRSSWAGWPWAAATASEGWHKQWHRTPGAQRRRLSGRESPPSSCTAARRLRSLKTDRDWQLHHHAEQEVFAQQHPQKTKASPVPWRHPEEGLLVILGFLAWKLGTKVPQCLLRKVCFPARLPENPVPALTLTWGIQALSSGMEIPE